MLKGEMTPARVMAEGFIRYYGLDGAVVRAAQERDIARGEIRDYWNAVLVFIQGRVRARKG